MNLRINQNPDGLSDMEIKVLIGTCHGLSSAEIGNRVNRSHRTVEKYRSDLYEKFYVNNKAELMQVANRLFKINGR